MKPLADHGTTARAKGRPAMGIPGCPCPPCRDAENRYDKRRRYLNATGRTLTVPTEPIAQHLDTLFDAGAGWTQLSAASGVSTSVISRIRRRQQPKVRRDVATRLLAIQPGDAIPPKRPVSALGTIRRIHALIAIGHTCKAISAASTVEHSMISDLLNERLTTVARSIAQRIDDGYRKLATTPGTCTRSLNRATRERWAPPVAWNDDIDHPEAIPDWTGHCGTDRGWHAHRSANMPACPACQTAHDKWLAERSHLDFGQRGQELRAARADANNRGTSLAEEAAWLEDHGHTRQQAADRLGVTKNYLDKAITRHRAATEEAAA